MVTCPPVWRAATASVLVESVAARQWGPSRRGGMPGDSHMSDQGERRDYEGESRVAQDKAAQALGRLLHPAETRDSGQVRRVAKFIAAMYDGQAYPVDLFEIRAVDAQGSS